MRGVWRSSAACGRLLPIGGLIYALLMILPTSALAQSGVGRAINTATGQSLEDAVQKNQNELMTGEGSGSAFAGVAVGAIPSGRLRTSDHDVLKTTAAPDGNFAWDTKEVSAFANGVYVMPGVVLGGQLKFSLFAGFNEVTLKLKNGGDDTLSTADGQKGSALNDSALFGGAVLWASPKGVYAMANLVGFRGETKLNDAIDFCNAPGLGCPMRHYRFDTSGFIGTLTTGQTFKLPGSASAPMLDIRGAASFTQNIGDTFFNHLGDEYKFKFSTWTLTGSATLFWNIAQSNSALLRPYIQGYVRQEVGYDNKLKFVDAGTPGVVHYDQAHTYGGVDVGLTYTLGKMTVGAAGYFDGSADERTFGGRLGASWKLN